MPDKPTVPRVPSKSKTKAEISIKRKQRSFASGGSSLKFQLTDGQKVQVAIIDWKRRSIRSQLFLSYVTIGNLLCYICVYGYGYPLVQESTWLIIAFYGFFLDLTLYLFGSGGAIKAISYVWSPIKFSLGIGLVLVAMVLNSALYWFGTQNSEAYQVTYGVPNRLILSCKTVANGMHQHLFKETEDEKLHIICDIIHSKVIERAIFCLPLVLPPVALICSFFSIYAALAAVKFVPDKFGKGKIDAKWLEPYETYDFYVGRYIPKIPGYDEGWDEHIPAEEIALNLREDEIAEIEGVVLKDQTPHEDHKDKGGKHKHKK